MANDRADRPPGLDVNPSAVGQRAPLVALGLLGLGISIACQLYASGAIPTLWEPLPIITEGGWVQQALAAKKPIVDVVGFSLVVGTTLLGPTDRWRSRRWLAVLSGFAVMFQAAAAVARWGTQFAERGATSTLFFLIVVISIALLPLAIDELCAALACRVSRVPRARAVDSRPVTHDWTEYVAGGGGLLLGIALLLFESSAAPRAAYQGRLLGGVVAALGALALAESGRVARWGNAAIGLWLVVAPLVLSFTVRGAIQSMTFGLLLLLVSAALGESASQSKDAAVNG